MVQTLENLNIKPIFCSIRHPQSNPTERVMRELGRLFRTLCSESHTRWAKNLPQIEYCLNITTHSSTGFSPYELHFGQKPRDQVQRLISFPEIKDLTHDEKIVIARRELKRNFEKLELLESSSKLMI